MRIVYVIVFLLFAQPGFAQSSASVMNQIKAITTREYPSLEKLYKELHQHPELSLQEINTSKIMADELRALGFEVTEKIGGHSLAAVFKNGPGPTVLIRTDMDALP